MTERTYNIIMAVKNCKQPWNQGVAEYMSKETGSPTYIYNESLINNIMKDAVVDYLSTCDNPNRSTERLLEMLMESSGHSFGFVVADYLGLVRVKKDGMYVNGFGEFKEIN